MSFYKKHLFFCNNTRLNGKKSCGGELATSCYRYAKDTMRDAGKLGKAEFGVSSSKCLGRCELGPVVVVYPDNIWYRYHNQNDIDLIIDNHLLGNKIVEELKLP
jgi:(2Fe-2S) ferredoxin